jgi:hypothetical protein
MKFGQGIRNSWGISSGMSTIDIENYISVDYLRLITLTHV